MVKSKLLRVILSLTLPVMLASCGGGGSSNTSEEIDDTVNSSPVAFSLDTTPDGVNDAYQGKKEVAELTPQLSLTLLESFYQFPFSDLDVDRFDAQAKVKKGVILNGALSRAVNDTRNGQVSGNYTIQGDINELGQGVLVAKWNNFSDFSGSRLHGSVVLNVVEFNPDYEVITKSTTKYDDLEIEIGGRKNRVNGYIVENTVLHEQTTTIYDLSIFDLTSNTWFAYDKLKVISNDVTYDVSGRYYKEDIGFVVIDTLAAIKDCLSCFPSHPEQTGQIRFSSSDDKAATFRFLDKKRISLSFNEPAQAEPSISELSWASFDSWKHENSPPNVQVTLPNYPPSNTDLVATINTFDGDLDEVTILSYNWKVNSVPISNNSNVLPATHFDAGDTVSIEVIVTDGVNAPADDDTAVGIENTRVTLELEDITITLGDELVLDASNAQDYDGDILHFEWLEGLEDGTRIETPNSIKTNVSFIRAGVFSFGLRIQEERNGVIVQTTGKSVKVTVLENDIFEDTQQIMSFSNFYNMDVSSIKVADLDGDQRNEILLAFNGSGDYTGKIASLSSRNSFSPQLIDTGEPSTSLLKTNTILVKDMNNDGTNDIVVPRVGGYAIIHQDSDAPGELEPTFYASETNLTEPTIQVETGDFNSDGLIDVVIMQEGTKDIEIFLQTENTEAGIGDNLRPSKFQPPIAYQTSTAVKGHDSNAKLRIADVSDDGLDDIVIVDTLQDTVGIFSDYDLLILKQKIGGGFATGVTILLSNDRYHFASSLGLGDFNNDNKTDIVVTPAFHDIKSSLDIYHQAPGGIFNEPRVVKTAHIGTDHLVIADIDNNGVDDIVYKHNHRSLALHKQSENNHISEVWSEYNLDRNSFIYEIFDVGDINNDGKADVIYAGDNYIHSLFGR